MLQRERTGGGLLRAVLSERRVAVVDAPHVVALEGDEPAHEDAFVHPYIDALRALAARLLGGEAFHGAAVVLEGRAWLLLGHSESGKSTLAAAFHRRGVPVLADDRVVVTPDLHVAAGARCIDLREPAPGGRPVRKGERFRVDLPPARARTPLAGTITLAWGDTPSLLRIDAPQLQESRCFWAAIPAPPDPLGIGELPAFRLTRKGSSGP